MIAGPELGRKTGDGTSVIGGQQGPIGSQPPVDYESEDQGVGATG